MGAWKKMNKHETCMGGGCKGGVQGGVRSRREYHAAAGGLIFTRDQEQHPAFSDMQLGPSVNTRLACSTLVQYVSASPEAVHQTASTVSIGNALNRELLNLQDGMMGVCFPFNSGQELLPGLLDRGPSRLAGETW